MTANKLPRRRWFRFSLRTLLVLVLVLAAPMAWIARERYQSQLEQQVAARLQQQGIHYIGLGGPYDSLELLHTDEGQGRWRDLAQRCLGDRILELTIFDPDFQDLTPLARLKNVQALSIQSTNTVSDLRPLSGLTRLNDLRLVVPQVSDLAPLSGLTNLYTLCIDNSQTSDLSPLAGLANLRHLYVGRSPVSDLKPLAGLTNLTSLHLNDTQVSSLSPIAGLAHLQELYVNGTQVSDLTPLVRLKNIQMLGISGTKVSDLSPLAELPKLRILFLHDTQVRDLSPLESLKNLNQLHLDRTQFSREQVARLLAAVPNCHINP